MLARIFKPAKTAMQSGQARTKHWILEYAPSEPPEVEPLMGWTSSGDMRQQIHLEFETREEAIAYCESRRIPYEIEEPKALSSRVIAYSDNFAYSRRSPWTH